MKKIGGMIALVAGASGIFFGLAFILSLFGAAVDAGSVAPLMTVFVRVIIYSLLILILAVAILRSTRSIPGLLILLLSIIGALITRPLIPVSLFLLLTGLGGFLAVMGGEEKMICKFWSNSAY